MRSIIKPGELNDMLSLQTKNTVYVDGFPEDTVTKLYDLWCKVKTVSTREFIEANRDGSAITYKFIVPREGLKITNEMFILYDEQEWNIKHVHFIDDFFYEL